MTDTYDILELSPENFERISRETHLSIGELEDLRQQDLIANKMRFYAFGHFYCISSSLADVILKFAKQDALLAENLEAYKREAAGYSHMVDRINYGVCSNPTCPCKELGEGTKKSDWRLVE